MSTTKSHAGEKIRGMGCHEAYQLAMHTLDQYRGTIIVCCYCPPPTLVRPESLGDLKTRFFDALAKVVLAQPHLQTGIVDENTKNPSFVRLDRLDLRNHVQWITLEDSSQYHQRYLETVQIQLDSRFENISTQPGWRVLILHQLSADSIEVLYVWNHVHHDGSGAKIFHQHLLRYLNETTKTEPVEDINNSDRWVLELKDPSDRLPPNPEKLSMWFVSPVMVVKELWKEFKPQRFFPPGDIYARWAPIKATPFRTGYRNFTLDSQCVAKIVQACRAHRTTVTGLVHAFFLVSLSTAIRDANGFLSRTPYDLRQILPSKTKQYPWLEPKKSMCNYVSVLDHEFDRKLLETIRSHIPVRSADAQLPADLMDIVWSVAARVRQEIKARLEAGTRNDLIGIMKLCPDWNAQQQNEMHKIRCISWVVTNLGVFDGDGGVDSNVGKEDVWSVRRAEMILSAETPSAAISVSIMTVKDRDMVVTGSWQDCVVDAELGQRLMSDLERWMMEIGS